MTIWREKINLILGSMEYSIFHKKCWMKSVKKKSVTGIIRKDNEINGYKNKHIYNAYFCGNGI
jgi:hypothetical protein